MALVIRPFFVVVVPEQGDQDCPPNSTSHYVWSPDQLGVCVSTEFRSKRRKGCHTAQTTAWALVCCPDFCSPRFLPPLLYTCSLTLKSIKSERETRGGFFFSVDDGLKVPRIGEEIKTLLFWKKNPVLSCRSIESSLQILPAGFFDSVTKLGGMLVQSLAHRTEIWAPSFIIGRVVYSFSLFIAWQRPHRQRPDRTAGRNLRLLAGRDITVRNCSLWKKRHSPPVYPCSSENMWWSLFFFLRPSLHIFSLPLASLSSLLSGADCPWSAQRIDWDRVEKLPFVLVLVFFPLPLPPASFQISQRKRPDRVAGRHLWLSKRVDFSVSRAACSWKGVCFLVTLNDNSVKLKRWVRSDRLYFLPQGPL